MTKYINDFILNYLYHKKLDSMQLVDTNESHHMDLLNDVYVLKLAKRKLHRSIHAQLKPKSRGDNLKTTKVPADFDSDSDYESNAEANAGEVLSCANMTVLQMIGGKTGLAKENPSFSKNKQKDGEKEEPDLTAAPVEDEEEQTESDADDEASEKEENYEKMDKLKTIDGIGFALERFKQSIFSMWVSLF